MYMHDILLKQMPNLEKMPNLELVAIIQEITQFTCFHFPLQTSGPVKFILYLNSKFSLTLHI